MQYKNTDRKKYKKYLKNALKINPYHNISLHCLGQEYRNEGEEGKGLKLQKKAFSSWKKLLEKNSLRDCDYSWFSFCARAIGKYDYAEYIEESEPKEEFDKAYSIDNLSKLKSSEYLTI
jgi:hypothetical protein